MHTNSTNRSPYSWLKSLVVTLILTLPLTFIFAYSSHKVVLAEDSPNFVESQIKEMVFGTRTELERSSRRPKFVYIKKGDQVFEVFTLQTDINKILKENNISIEEGEKVVLSTGYVTSGSLVKVIKMETVIEDIFIEIPFDVKTVNSDEYAKGEEVISQEGVLGVRKQRVLNYFEDGILIESALLSDVIHTQPQDKIIAIGTSTYSLNGIEPRGYNCPYWYSVVDAGPYTDQEKQWLKHVMYCESGCNAESNKSSFKGLFQWKPSSWKISYSQDNIFDGNAQIRNTMDKIHKGVNPYSFWPACHKQYVAKYGEFVR